MLKRKLQLYPSKDFKNYIKDMNINNINQILSKESISLNSLKLIYDYLNKEIKNGREIRCTFFDLLRFSHISFVNEQNKDDIEDQNTNRTSETLKMRRKYLLRLQEEKIYNNMTKGMKRKTKIDYFQNEINSFRHHISIGINMIVVQITAFIACYFVSKQLTTNETTRILCGLAGAIVMMIIEMILYITRSSKHDEIIRQNQIRNKEKNK